MQRVHHSDATRSRFFFLTIYLFAFRFCPAFHFAHRKCVSSCMGRFPRCAIRGSRACVCVCELFLFWKKHIFQWTHVVTLLTERFLRVYIAFATHRQFLCMNGSIGCLWISLIHTHAAAAEDRRSTSVWMTALAWRKIDYTWKESEQNHLCEHLKQRKRTKYNIFAFMLWAERLWLDRCAASCLMVHSYDFTILQYYMHIAQTTQIPN